MVEKKRAQLLDISATSNGREQKYNTHPHLLRKVKQDRADARRHPVALSQNVLEESTDQSVIDPDVPEKSVRMIGDELKAFRKAAIKESLDFLYKQRAEITMYVLAARAARSLKMSAVGVKNYIQSSLNEQDRRDIGMPNTAPGKITKWYLKDGTPNRPSITGRQI